MQKKLQIASRVLIAAVAMLLSLTAMADEGRKLRKEVKPMYPALARQAHVTGLVRLELTIAPSGKVKKASVLGGSPLLAESATEAVKEWQYEPAAQETISVVVINFSQQF